MLSGQAEEPPDVFCMQPMIWLLYRYLSQKYASNFSVADDIALFNMV